MADLDALEAALAAATPGEWKNTEKRGKRDGYVRADGRTIADVRYRNGEADAHLIALARNALPDLIALARGAQPNADLVRAAGHALRMLETMDGQANPPLSPDHMVSITVETWRDHVRPRIGELRRALLATGAGEP